jgi:MoaA/NifB/PqqE/SkfB family radical SAM enzyme
VRLVRLGYACNNACSFCAQGALAERPYERPSAEDLLAAIAPGDRVCFVGGEPTLQPDLPELIRGAIARGAAATIVQTNARRLAYPAYARALSDAGLSGIDASLVGATAPMHEIHTRIAGSFSQTLSGIANAARLGIDVGITVVVTRSNYRHLSDIVRLAHRLRAQHVHLQSVRAVGRAVGAVPPLVPPAELVAPFVREAKLVARGLRVELVTDVSPDTLHALFGGIGDVEPLSA